MLAKPPFLLPDKHQVNDTLKEHPAKDADTDINKIIIHDLHITKRIGHVTSGLSVGNILPSNKSSMSSINNRENKSSVNISSINDRNKAALILIMTAEADKKKSFGTTK